QQYAGAALDFPPGSNYSYSNTGFIILARVGEKVTGKTFGELLQQRIFDKLGMRHTVYEPATTAGNNHATGYRSFALGPPEVAEPEGRGWLGGAGGIRSTAADLSVWDKALAEGILLKPESWKLMKAPVTLTDGRNSEYGDGINVNQRNGYTTVTHNGAVSGFMAANTLIPETRSAVVILSNCEQPLGDLKQKLFDLLTTRVEHIPVVAGDPALAVAQAVFRQFQAGKLERSRFGAEYNRFVTDKKLAQAAQRLQKLGKIAKADVLSRGERGGMEVTTTRIECKGGACKVLMYRLPSGEIQEYLILP
ncbi:MAG TPA: serine hydrolase domain-containing protein, partial [Verrucomicrobiae bacterium]|nr:serine hydrolase domain-containing protein [Verrucomicrobiae bacterium]